MDIWYQKSTWCCGATIKPFKKNLMACGKCTQALVSTLCTVAMQHRKKCVLIIPPVIAILRSKWKQDGCWVHRKSGHCLLQPLFCISLTNRSAKSTTLTNLVKLTFTIWKSPDLFSLNMRGCSCGCLRIMLFDSCSRDTNMRVILSLFFPTDLTYELTMRSSDPSGKPLSYAKSTCSSVLLCVCR